MGSQKERRIRMWLEDHKELPQELKDELEKALRRES